MRQISQCNTNFKSIIFQVQATKLVQTHKLKSKYINYLNNVKTIRVKTNQ